MRVLWIDNGVLVMAVEKPLLALDLFCGAGGAGAGLARAGFEVIGVDFWPQPAYPFRFVQQDVFNLPLWFLRTFDLIWASPPCQAHTKMKTMHNAKPHVDLIPPTRAMLRHAGKPFVIENVEGAPLENPITLCGTMFGLGTETAELHRHRLFETNFPVMAPDCRHGLKPSVIGVYGGHARNRRRREGSASRGVEDFSKHEAKRAMGVDWPVTFEELSEAIPPAYSEYIARAALAEISARKAA